eukprot:scaffold1499_cov170-Amphora_coffeaeformis.AAC.6
MPWDSSCNTDVSPDTPLFEARQQQHKLGQQETNSLKLAKQSLKLKGSGLSILSDGVESPEEDDLMDQEERPVESFVRPVPLTAEDIEAELGEQEKRQDDTGIVRVMRGSRSADDISRIQSLVEIYHHRMPSTIMEEPMDTGDDEDDNSKNQKLPHPLKKNDTLLANKNTSPISGLRRRKSADDIAKQAHTGKFNYPEEGKRQQQQYHEPAPPLIGSPLRKKENTDPAHFEAFYSTTKFFESISARLLKQHYTPFAAATWIGFWALLNVTCANYVLTPMRDAIALSIGVEHIPNLTLASTVLAFFSSVPIGWLFEAPDPNRRKMFKRMGLTRGETQGTSLALFYRCFALILVSYAIGFSAIEWLKWNDHVVKEQEVPEEVRRWWPDWTSLFTWVGTFLYIAFFLVVHLMKLHCLSLVWGVTTEAMEYEEVARRKSKLGTTKTRLERLALVGFGGTLGGVIGSGLASSMARLLRLPGLLLLAASLLEVSAELSIELGRIMQKHWTEQQLFQSQNDLHSLDASMKKSASVGSMKRIASGNSLNKVKSACDLTYPTLNGSAHNNSEKTPAAPETVNDDTFFQRLLRGVTTILRSRLLMAIFTYNALYASTTVLLSFQRAALVASRNDKTSTEADTAFLANINMASSVAVFVLQASGVGAVVAQTCGPRGTLVLMPLIRLLGVLSLAWWHHAYDGKPPDLLLFLVVDECCKIMNLSVAKPVRESLWRGLSNEARYEAKPIVDTLANRWGSGSAAFLVSFLNRTLDLLGFKPAADGTRAVFGFPPVLLLCMTIAAWWAVVSADLGHIRHRIDLELKKRQ